MNIEKNQEYIVKIIDNGFEGEGIAKIDGFIIFIPGAIKGEKVKILIVKVLSSHAFGKILEILEKSEARQDADCATYKRCGGCNLRHVKYEETLKMKQNAVQSLVNKTLKNKQLDEDRRRTLAINQGLTFALSTIGSYTIDNMLDSKWERLTAKYAQKQTGDSSFIEKLAQHNKEKLAKFNADKTAGKLAEDAKFKTTSVLDYIAQTTQDKGLESRLRGMGVLKKLVVFGTVYRFLAPVAVTPFATMIGNKLVHAKNNVKQADNNQNNKQENTKKA